MSAAGFYEEVINFNDLKVRKNFNKNSLDK